VLSPSGCAGVYKKRCSTRSACSTSRSLPTGDVDLACAADGWYNCIYVPAAVVYHKYSATTGTYSPQKAFLAERNRLWLLFKNFRSWIYCFPFSHLPAIFLHLKGVLTGKVHQAGSPGNIRQGRSSGYPESRDGRPAGVAGYIAETACMQGIPPYRGPGVPEGDSPIRIDGRGSGSQRLILFVPSLGRGTHCGRSSRSGTWKPNGAHVERPPDRGGSRRVSTPQDCPVFPGISSERRADPRSRMRLGAWVIYLETGV